MFNLHHWESVRADEQYQEPEAQECEASEPGTTWVWFAVVFIVAIAVIAILRADHYATENNDEYQHERTSPRAAHVRAN